MLVLSSKGSVYRSSDRGSTWDKLAEVFHRKGLLQIGNDDVKVLLTHPFIGWCRQQNLTKPCRPLTCSISGHRGYQLDLGRLWCYNQCHRGIKVLYLCFPVDKCASSNSILAIKSGSWQHRGRNVPPMRRKTASSPRTLCLVWTWVSIGLKLPHTSTNSHGTGLITHTRRAAKTVEMLEFVPEKRILVSFEPTGSGHQKLSGWNMKTHLFYSDDFLKSKIMIVNQGNKFLLTANFLFVA